MLLTYVKIELEPRRFLLCPFFYFIFRTSSLLQIALMIKKNQKRKPNGTRGTVLYWLLPFCVSAIAILGFCAPCGCAPCVSRGVRRIYDTLLAELYYINDKARRILATGGRFRISASPSGKRNKQI